MIVLLLLFSSLFSLASNSFNLEEVLVECKKSIPCDQRVTRFMGLVGEYRSLVHLKDTLRVMASDGGYQSFVYKLEESEDKHTLYINFKLKPLINEVKLVFKNSKFAMDSFQLIGLREGEFFEIQKLKESLLGLKERLDSLGYPLNTHEYEVVEKKDKVNIFINVELGTPRIFKNSCCRKFFHYSELSTWWHSPK
jgi:outer membrane protein assembly factor BamA